MLFTLSLFLSTNNTRAAQWANPDLLVDADTVKANIDKPDWVVVDARELKDYAKGHIPGAISLGERGKKALRDPSARIFNDTGKYEALLGKVGIGNDTHVVFYYDGLKTIHDATIGFWILEYLGHDKVHVLNGGLDAWRKGGNRLDTTPTIKPEKTFKANVVASRLAPTAEIVEIGNGNGKGTQLIDSRTKDEYLGKDIRAIKGGHIRNAANVSDLETMVKVNDPKTGKPKETEYISPESVSVHFKDLDPAKRTVAYCQTGTRSTLTYLQLRLMGFTDPANWDESWRVYASDLHANYPIEAPNGVQYYDFDKVNKTLKELDKKVIALEETVIKLTGSAK